MEDDLTNFFINWRVAYLKHEPSCSEETLEAGTKSTTEQMEVNLRKY